MRPGEPDRAPSPTTSPRRGVRRRDRPDATRTARGTRSRRSRTARSSACPPRRRSRRNAHGAPTGPERAIVVEVLGPRRALRAGDVARHRIERLDLPAISLGGAHVQDRRRVGAQAGEHRVGVGEPIGRPRPGLDRDGLSRRRRAPSRSALATRPAPPSRSAHARPVRLEHPPQPRRERATRRRRRRRPVRSPPIPAAPSVRANASGLGSGCLPGPGRRVAPRGPDRCRRTPRPGCARPRSSGSPPRCPPSGTSAHRRDRPPRDALASQSASTSSVIAA